MTGLGVCLVALDRNCAATIELGLHRWHRQEGGRQVVNYQFRVVLVVVVVVVVVVAPAVRMAWSVT